MPDSKSRNADRWRILRSEPAQAQFPRSAVSDPRSLQSVARVDAILTGASGGNIPLDDRRIRIQPCAAGTPTASTASIALLQDQLELTLQSSSSRFLCSRTGSDQGLELNLQGGIGDSDGPSRIELSLEFGGCIRMEANPVHHHPRVNEERLNIWDAARSAWPSLLTIAKISSPSGWDGDGKSQLMKTHRARLIVWVIWSASSPTADTTSAASLRWECKVGDQLTMYDPPKVICTQVVYSSMMRSAHTRRSR